MRRSVVGILGLVALGTTVAACGSSKVGAKASPTSNAGAATTQATLTNVSVGDFPASALTLPFTIAQDQRFFRDAGLNVQAVMAKSGPELMSELIGGTTQIAVEVPPNAFPAMQQGEPLVVLPPFGRLDLAVVSPDGAGVTDLHSLQGKRIGVTQRGAFTEKFARYVLQGQGINPDSATFVAVGDLLTQEVALRNHQIDASVFSSDAIAAATAHGITLHVLASSLNGTAGALGNIGLQSFWATTSGYQSSHPAVVNAFRTAMTRAATWLADNANRSAGLPSVEKLLNIPPDVAGQVWDTVHTAWSSQLDAARWSANVELILGNGTSLPFDKFVATGTG